MPTSSMSVPWICSPKSFAYLTVHERRGLNSGATPVPVRNRNHWTLTNVNLFILEWERLIYNEALIPSAELIKLSITWLNVPASPTPTMGSLYSMVVWLLFLGPDRSIGGKPPWRTNNLKSACSIWVLVENEKRYTIHRITFTLDLVHGC